MFHVKHCIPETEGPEEWHMDYLPLLTAHVMVAWARETGIGSSKVLDGE